jgi:hypothetical protein
MKYKVVEDADVVTYVVVCDPGDEAVTALTQFAQARRAVRGHPGDQQAVVLVDQLTGHPLRHGTHFSRARGRR